MQEDLTAAVDESAVIEERHAHRYSRSIGPDGHVMTPEQRGEVDHAATLVLAAGARKDTVLFHDGSAAVWDASEHRWDVYATADAYAGPIPGNEGRAATWNAEAAHWDVAEADGSDALPEMYRRELTHGRR